jgi:capsular exopolysaccharide synthesis family protein
MSQIFDALQRSEAERAGRDPNASTRATELLRQAEQFMESRRGNGKAPENWDVVDTPSQIALGEPAQPEPLAHGLPDKSAVQTENQYADGIPRFENIQVSAPPDGHLVCLPEAESLAGEAFYLLGVRLRHMRRQQPLKKLLITSTIPQEGKSVCAANLACALALKTQQRVLLLEGDLRRPSQAKVFGIQNRPGICDWLRGERDLARSIYNLEGAGIWLLPAGFATGNSLELLQSGKLSLMMDQLVKWFDWVIADSPPILPLADTSVWVNLVDGILLVTRQGTTQRRHLKRGLETLGTHKLIGAILNSSQGVANTDYYYRPSDRLRSDDSEN